MAQVPTVTIWQDAVVYLQRLKGTVIADVRPLLDLPGHAPFAICREVFSYVDHVGHLYSGKDGVGERFCLYLKEILKSADARYEERCKEIYQMFRCGPVHEFEPKILENKRGEVLVWLCYAGDRNDTLEGTTCNVSHLKLIAIDPKTFWLPVSTKCLIDDLTASIDAFAVAGPEDERITAWNRAARKLAVPEPYDFLP